MWGTAKQSFSLLLPLKLPKEVQTDGALPPTFSFLFLSLS